MTSWTKDASNMKGIALKAAFSLVLMFEVVFESFREFFEVVLFDILLEFAGFSSNFRFKCPEGYLKMAQVNQSLHFNLPLSHFSLKIAKTSAEG